MFVDFVLLLALLAGFVVCVRVIVSRKNRAFSPTNKSATGIVCVVYRQADDIMYFKVRYFEPILVRFLSFKIGLRCFAVDRAVYRGGFWIVHVIRQGVTFVLLQ